MNENTIKSLVKILLWGARVNIIEVDLPSCIFELYEETGLHLNNNDGADLSAVLPHFSVLTNLQYLHLRSCDLDDLPPILGVLGNLKVLDIANNYFADLPSVIENLTGLVHLTIDDFVIIPDTINETNPNLIIEKVKSMASDFIIPPVTLLMVKEARRLANIRPAYWPKNSGTCVECGGVHYPGT